MRKLLINVFTLIFVLHITACGSAQSAPPASEPVSGQPSSAPLTAEQVSEPPAPAPLQTESDPQTPPEIASAPASPEAGKETELIVFAAASMTETLEEIAKLYAIAEPSVKLTFNFDSSGTLKTQIQEGAACDLFLSAGQKQMDELDITASPEVNTEKLDFVLDRSRIDLLENRVTLAVPDGNPAGIGNFEEMAAALPSGDILMAMGNSDVPVGQYTQRILEYFELNEEELANSGRITYGTNVKEVTIQISEASVDCGVIYCTDAFSAGLEIAAYASEAMCGRIIYPAAVLKTSEQPAAAQAFLDYLTSDEAIAVFEKVGFSEP